MKLCLDCYPCFLRQTLQAARFSGADEETQRRALVRTMQILSTAPENSTPPQISESIHQAIREETHSTDNYLEVKAISTQQALAVYPTLKKWVEDAANRFEMAAHIAVIGNMIDFAVTNSINIEENIKKDIAVPLSCNHSAQLKTQVENAPWVLYLADNAGETVFDRILIETMQHQDIRYVVKSGPALNDALRKDAEEAGLDKLTTIFETGAQAVGVVPQRASDEFLSLLKNAPVIIAKGQANYESLSGTDHNIFFLFKVKCEMVSALTGMPLGSQLVYNEHI